MFDKLPTFKKKTPIGSIRLKIILEPKYFPINGFDSWNIVLITMATRVIIKLRYSHIWLIIGHRRL